MEGLDLADYVFLDQKHQCLKEFSLDAAKELIYLQEQERGWPSKKK